MAISSTTYWKINNEQIEIELIEKVYVRGMVLWNGFKLKKIGYGVYMKTVFGDKILVKQYTTSRYPMAVAHKRILNEIIANPHQKN